MSQENVEVVRRILERLGKAGEPDLSKLDPNIEVHDHELPDSKADALEAAGLSQ
jgi:HEAT repeat protein